MKTFVEIGSCDFDTLNYLSDRGWKGVIVEPIKKYLNNIEQKPHVHYLNYAIDLDRGVRIMRTAPDSLVETDREYAGMSSFINMNELLSEEQLVNTITFDDLIDLCNITQIDYLKIDAEGYDWVLISNFPYDKIKPKFIQVESEHLNGKEMGEFLANRGYHINCDTTDLYALLIDENY